MKDSLFRKIEVSRALLVLIMALLTFSTFVAIFLMVKLESDVLLRRTALENRSLLDDLDTRFMDRAIVVDTIEKGIKDHEFNEEFQKIDSDIHELVSNINERYKDSAEARNLIEDLNSYWAKISTDRKGFSDQDSKEFQSKRDQLELLEEKIIEKSDLAVRESLKTPLLVLTLMLSLVIIGVLLYFFISRAEAKKRQERITEIEFLKNRAEAALETRKKFMAVISHEIRTPLNGIMGMTDVLRRAEVDAKVQKSLSLIYDSGKILMRIVNDILDYSALESGELRLNRTRFDLHSLADRIVASLEGAATKKGLMLECQVDEDLPREVIGDSDRLSQVLINLLNNSIKFTSEGRIELRILNCHKNSKKVKVGFSVMDTGPGIEPKNIKFLFIPFSKTHRLGTKDEPGTGLGLSISQSIVKAMGGELVYKALENQTGSNFYFEIEMPFEVVKGEQNSVEINEDVPFPLAEPVSAGIDIPTAMLPRVLVVEDNPTNQVVAEAMLSRLKVRPVLASDGIEALELMEKFSFDVIFMDCQMPRMNGYDATKEIRRRGFSKPIIAMTADVSKDSYEQCEASGMDSVIGKPLVYSKLEEVVHQLATHPDTNIFEPAEFNQLSKKIGEQAGSKVLESYLETLSEYRSGLKTLEIKNDLDGFKRLGHKYKGSSLMVGAVKLGKYSENLENLQRLGGEKIFLKELKELIEKTQSTLAHYSSIRQNRPISAEH